jgi:PKD repeat protein
MSFRSDDRGAAIQVGAIILFAFVILAITAYQASVVPNQNNQIEYNHNQELQSQLQDLEGAIGSTSSAGERRTVTIDLGTEYPARTIFVNPPNPSGRLETVGTNNPDVNFSVANAVATNEDANDFWNGDPQNYSTGSVVYRPNYNVYSEAPTTVVEHSLVYNEFRDGTRLTVNSQSVFDGDTISLVALRGDVSEQTGTVNVNVRPVSSSTQSIRVENASGDNVKVSLVTRLSASEWRGILLDDNEFANQTDGGYVTSIAKTGEVSVGGGVQANVIEFELERDVTYTLQMARVGVGDLSGAAETTDPAYAVALADTVTTDENVNATVTVEVRDRYNNPKAGVTVNATAVGPANGNIVENELTTNEDGRVTFTYNTTEEIDGNAKTDTVRVSVVNDPSTNWDANAPLNVTTHVTVRNTDGSGTGGGGGGGGGAYGIEFDNAPSYDWNVTEEGDRLQLIASTTPETLEGVSTDFAVNSSSVASVNDGMTDTETNSNGHATVTLDAHQNGSVAVYVGSSGGSDVINIMVTDVGGGGGGGNSDPSASFTYSPSSPKTGESVSFDASASSDSDGSISSYSWDFGDGDTATGENPSHTYTSDGSYTVTLTVTDDDGATDTTTKTVSVSNQGPTADFTITPSSAQTGETVSFDGSASNDPDGSIVSYEWTLGDGTTASGPMASNQYGDDGTYSVTLTVTDDDGATHSVTKTVTVSNRGPSAAFTWSCTGATCSFDASGSSDPDGSISSYEWDFGDGTTGSGQTTTHTFSPPGTYTVTLTVTDDDGDTATQTKTISTGGGITFGQTTTWAGENSVVQQELSSNRNDDVTIVAVKVNETAGNVRTLDGSRLGYPEIEFYDSNGRTGYADASGGYTLPSNMSLETDGSTVIFESGEGQTLYLTEFENNGGQPVGMVGETLTITITYRVNGVTYKKTVTVTVQ